MSFFVLDRLVENFRKFPDRNAFCIAESFFSYSHFRNEIAGIQKLLLDKCQDDEKIIGLLTQDDIQTYASIFAIWFSGKAFVPLNPNNPDYRNADIAQQTGIRTVLSSKIPSAEFKEALQDTTMCISSGLDFINKEIEYLDASIEDNCYLLFTSGSTGRPKGVPVSRKNLGSFAKSFIEAGYKFTEEDRFLQIYDLSFDASVHCYTVPLAVGGCVYTVPQDQIKYLYAYKLMKDQELSFVKMPPSTLFYLQPYFSSIRLTKLRYCLLGGEPFPVSLAESWSKCVPNASIQNVYGPTEATINTHIFEWSAERSEEKNYNGILSIGKCFGDNIAIVIDEDLKPLENGESGELCLGGDQLVEGYWKDEEKTESAFFEADHKGKISRFYRTGDRVRKDKDGDLLFEGRIDSQVQIQGYRVELGEIEKHARDFLKKHNVSALSLVNEINVSEIFLFLENAEGMEQDTLEYLESKIPSYMLPKQIKSVLVFPKSAGGKINQNALRGLI